MPREVDLEHRVDVRRRPPARHHVLGDAPAHHAHRLDPPAWIGRHRRLRRDRQVDARPAATCHKRQHIGLRDTAGVTGAHERGQVDPVLGGESPHDRRWSARCRRGGDRPGCRPARTDGGNPAPTVDRPGVYRGRSGHHRLAIVVDHPHNGVDRDRLPFLGANLNQHTACRRRNLCVDLIGRDLEERLIGVNHFADLLGPAHDRALCDGLTHLRHQYIGWHLLV